MLALRITSYLTLLFMLSISASAPSMALTSVDCYDPSNSGTVGQTDWTGCAGMYIATNSELANANRTFAITSDGVSYTFADGGAGNVFTGQVTDMSALFYGVQFNGDIGYWDTSRVTDMDFMFAYSATFNQDIGNWYTPRLTRMNSMFMYATAFNQDIGRWNTASVTLMRNTFYRATAFNQDIGRWNTASVTNMTNMFDGARTFNQDIGNWNTGRVTNMRDMFRENTAFNQDIGRWNTASVIDMHGMFEGATAFNQDIGRWITAFVTDMNGMFKGASTFDQDISRWDVRQVGWRFSPDRRGTIPTDFDTDTTANWMAREKPNFGSSGAPWVAGVTSYTADASYRAGRIILIRVFFSQVVTVTGTPQLTLETGTTDSVATYISGSRSNVLTFSYVVQASDTTEDLDYISSAALALNGGTIRNEAALDAILSLPEPGEAGSLGANKAIAIQSPGPCILLINPQPLDFPGSWVREISPRSWGSPQEPILCFEDPRQACEANRTNQPSPPFPVRPQQARLEFETREVSALTDNERAWLDSNSPSLKTKSVKLIQCVYFYTCYYDEDSTTASLSAGVYLSRESSCKYWDSTLDLETSLACPTSQIPVRSNPTLNSFKEVYGPYHVFLHGVGYRCVTEGPTVVTRPDGSLGLVSRIFAISSFRSLFPAAITSSNTREVKSRPVETLAQLGLTSSLLSANLFNSVVGSGDRELPVGGGVTGFHLNGSPSDCSLPGNATLPQCTSAQYRRSFAAPNDILAWQSTQNIASPRATSAPYVKQPVRYAPSASGPVADPLTADAIYQSCYRINQPGVPAGQAQHIVVRGPCPSGYSLAGSQFQQPIQSQSSWHAAGPKPSNYVVSAIAGSGNLSGVGAFSQGYRVAVPAGKRKKLTLFAAGFGGTSSAPGFSRNGLISPSLSGSSFGGTAGIAYQFTDNLEASFGGVYLSGSSESQVETQSGQGGFALTSDQSGVGALARLNYRHKIIDLDTRIAAVYFNSNLTREDTGAKSERSSLIAVGRVQAGFNLAPERSTFIIKPFLGGELAFASLGEGLVNTGNQLLEAEARSGFSLNGDAGISLSTIWQVNEKLSLSPKLTGSISVPLVELTLESEAQDVLANTSSQAVNLVQSAESEQLTYVISPSVSAQVEDFISFNLGYSGRFADQSTTHSGTAQVAFTF